MTARDAYSSGKPRFEFADHPYSITNYLQHNASPATQAVYGVVFTLGVVPAILLFLWVRYVTVRWPVFREVPASP